MCVRTLSALSGVSESVIYNIETDEHRPHESTVEALATALGVRVNEIYLPRGTTSQGKPAKSCGRSGMSSVARRGNICGVCFIERSLTGVCDCNTL